MAAQVAHKSVSKAKATMIGVASPLVQPAARPAQRTLVDVAPMAGSSGPAPVAVAPAPVAVQPAPAAAPVVAGQKTLVMANVAAPAQPANLGNKTLVMGTHGVPLGPRPTPPAPPAPSASSNKKTLVGVPGAPSPTVTRGRTLFGIAMPSLAPAEPQYIEEEYEEYVPETGEMERRVRVVELPPRPLYQRPGFYAFVGALLLLAGGVAAALFIKGAPPLRAEAMLDAEGKDALRIACAGCPDGTIVSLPTGERGEIKAGESQILLTAPLRVGDNELSIAIDRPGSGRDETIKAQVPVAYRIKPDIAGLDAPSPAVRVDVDAVPGSTVTVQDRAVALDAQGHGSALVDVMEALRALPRDVKTFEQSIPYVIASGHGEPAKGSLQVRVGVASLSLDAPGAQLVTEQPTFLLAGRMTKGGTLTAAGAPIASAPDGTFKQHMKISAPGSTDVLVRASAPGLAPRFATVRVKLVQSLTAEARTLDAQGRPGYDDVAAKLEQSASTPVAWQATVISSSAQANRTIAVVEVSTGCSKKPCRARVSLPAGEALSTGAQIGVYGRVVGAAVSEAMRLPDIEADFFIKAP